MKRTTNFRQVEKYATLLKRLGYSAAFGQIFGYLISADPPYRTFDDIVTELKLSKGAVSMVLRAMEQHGYVDYFYKTGDRKRYFRISMTRWRQGLEQKIEDSAQFTDLLRTSLAACDPRHQEHRDNITKLITFEQLFQAKMQEIISSFRSSSGENKQ